MKRRKNMLKKFKEDVGDVKNTKKASFTLTERPRRTSKNPLWGAADVVDADGNFHTLKGEPLGLFSVGDIIENVSFVKEISNKYGEQLKITGYSPMMGSSMPKLLDILKRENPEVAFSEDIFNAQTPDEITERDDIPRQIVSLVNTKKTLLQYERLIECLQNIEYKWANLIFNLMLMEYDQKRIDKELETLRENPYALTEITPEIPFANVDNIGLGSGIAHDDQRRLAGFCHYLFRKADVRSGHSFLSRKEFRAFATRECAASGPHVINILPRLDELLAFLIEKGYLVDEESRLYLSRRYEQECNIARRLREMTELPPPISDKLEIEARIIFWQKNHPGRKLSPEQKAALKMMLGSPVVLLTGGPGTGKTTVLKAFREIYQAKYTARSSQLPHLHFVAPTGKAAQRIGMNAQTIHRFLRCNGRGERSFMLNWEKPLENVLVVIDETSMVPLYLMSALLDGIDENSRVLIVGDPEQLPSIGAGRVLEDLILSGKIPVCKLETIHRQADGSGIAMLARSISECSLQSMPAAADDLCFIEAPDGESCMKNVRQEIEKILERNKEDQDIRDKIFAIAPMKKHNGTEDINRELRPVLCPDAVAIPELGKMMEPLCLRDRVLYTQNDYDLNLWNGDIGFLTEATSSLKTIAAAFQRANSPDEPTNLSAGQIRDNLVPAYALTVHKMQGSEAPIIFFVCTREHQRMLNRRLIYTAVSRASRRLYIVGQRELFFSRCEIDETERHSTLAQRLKGELPA